eukprot:CAMPEP_0185536668 /NCGR_PEP_ID=MMETSP1366-20130426/110059_1 /TAXON_ID=38817 /ORGANISM="Gephyrocapsa oceanica, Strain RCC1303" /LENGTH=271 /DNA_ID=CAMNT_0028148389 /DNA_START=697 /DNA_END=1512 /DNA_ORIENTATION=-
MRMGQGPRQQPPRAPDEESGGEWRPSQPSVQPLLGSAPGLCSGRKKAGRTPRDSSGLNGFQPLPRCAVTTGGGGGADAEGTGTREAARALPWAATPGFGALAAEAQARLGGAPPPPLLHVGVRRRRRRRGAARVAGSPVAARQREASPFLGNHGTEADDPRLEVARPVGHAQLVRRPRRVQLKLVPRLVRHRDPSDRVERKRHSADDEGPRLELAVARGENIGKRAERLNSTPESCRRRALLRTTSLRSDAITRAAIKATSSRRRAALDGW